MESPKNALPTLSTREKRYGLRYLLFQAVFLASLLQSFNALLSHPLSAGLLNFLYGFISCAACCFIFGTFIKKNLLRAYRFPKEVLVYGAGGFAVYYLCSSALSLLIVRLFPDFVNLNDDRIVSLTGSDPVFMFLATVLLAPISEELLYRALVFGALHEKYPVGSYIVSALIFCAIHVISYVGVYPIGYLALALLQYLPAGLIFAWCYRKSGTIVTPILIHIANNLLVNLSSR